MIAYNGSLLMWFTYVAVTRPARDASHSLLQPQRWEQSLADIQHPLPADSLIPMFEGMVDRALSRTRPEPTAPVQPTKVVSQKPAAAPTHLAAIVGSRTES
jgi:hypothetical protein